MYISDCSCRLLEGQTQMSSSSNPCLAIKFFGLPWMTVSQTNLPPKIIVRIKRGKNPCALSWSHWRKGRIKIREKNSFKSLSCITQNFFFPQNVIELNLSDNPAWTGDKGNTKGDKYDDIQSARFICPVVGLEMNGRHRLVSLFNCTENKIKIKPCVSV